MRGRSQDVFVVGLRKYGIAGKFDVLSDHEKTTFRLSLPFLRDPSCLVSAAAKLTVSLYAIVKLRPNVNTSQTWGQTWSWWVIRIGEEQSSTNF